MPSGDNNGNGDFRFPDMPEKCLQGKLGEICLQELGDFPIAYSWPALLAAASAMIVERAPSVRTNLYVGLVGPVHSGKSQVIERACALLGLTEPNLLEAFIGSGEQLVRCTSKLAGQSVCFAPDELSHLFDKMHIEHSSFSSLLNRAFGRDSFNVMMGKKETKNFDCVLSLVGGIVEEKFQKLFDASTTGGLYDRFMFGYLPHESNYHYKPFKGKTYHIEPRRVCIEHAVYQETYNWLQLHPDWNQRVIEIALRAATVAAAFDGKTLLSVEDLNPVYEFVRYQTLVREVLKPNPGENFEGKIANKMINFLRRYNGAFVGKREMYMRIRAYDIGLVTADRALLSLIANGDVEKAKVGKELRVKWVTDEEHRDQKGPAEDL